MKTIVVLTCELVDPEDIAVVLAAIDPPHVPFFQGQVRIAIEGDAQHVLDYLDGGQPT